MKKQDPQHPPRLFLFFFRWFCNEHFLEDIEGDLLERFDSDLLNMSVKRAKWRFIKNVLFLFRPGIIGFTYHHNAWLLTHHLKISFRVLSKNKWYTAVNVTGLSTALVVVCLIALWVQDELSYNRNFEHYDRIVQVYRNENSEGQTSTNLSQMPGLGTLLKTDFEPVFEKVAMVRSRPEDHVLSYDATHFTQSGLFMEAEGPHVFSLEMVEGSRNGLDNLQSILLSKSTANKMFGATSAINQVVQIDGQYQLTVTGVYEDLPKNSVFYGASFIASLEWYVKGWTTLDVWDNSFVHIYGQLRTNQSVSMASKGIEGAMLEHMDEAQFNARQPKLFLLPMADWHLHSTFENGKLVTSAKLKLVLVVGVIGVFIVLLACTNFINLSTASAQNRAKEIGLRKTLGSIRFQLVNQFLSETFILVLLSFALSLVLVQVSIPWFNQLSDKQLILPLKELYFWFASVALLFVLTLLAGSYPAFVLSSMRPIKAIKGQFNGKYNTVNLRKGLVVFQFSVSLMIIIGTLVVHDQIAYVKKRDMGYEKSGLISFQPGSPAYFSQFQTLRHELKQTGFVEEIAAANYPITTTRGNNSGFEWEGKPDQFDPSFNTIWVTPEYGATIGWQVRQGRDFSRVLDKGANNIILTESTRVKMGLEHPIGAVVQWKTGGEEARYTIVGVVEDMVKGSPFDPVKPAIIFPSLRELPWLFIKVSEQSDFTEALPAIGAAFNKVIPEAPFDYKFVSDQYNAKFQSEEQIGQLTGVLAVLAIFISCLGLLGLISFVVKQKTKEISIRKVLGASVVQLWHMVSKEFAILVLFSFVVAVPTAVFILTTWLEQFAYKTEIRWNIFAQAGMGTMALVLTTISFHLLRSIFTNPVDTLKEE